MATRLLCLLFVLQYTSAVFADSISPDQLREFAEHDRFHGEIDELVVGQYGAKDAIRRGLEEVIDPDSVGVVMLMGPSGTGKSYIPRVVSRLLQDLGDWSDKTFDGSTFRSARSEFRLFGHARTGAEGSLSRFLDRYPESTIVFENFDKVHRSIKTRLYRDVFLNGVVNDSGTGETVRITRGLFILTANCDDRTPIPGCSLIDDWDRWHLLGVEPTNPAVKTWDQDRLKEEVLTSLTRSGRISPQLIGLMSRDNFAITHHFTRADATAIGMRILDSAARRFLRENVNLVFSDRVQDWMIDTAWGSDGSAVFENGARAVMNVYRHQIQPAISEFASGDGFDPDRIHPVIWDVDHSGTDVIVSER